MTERQRFPAGTNPNIAYDAGIVAGQRTERARIEAEVEDLDSAEDYGPDFVPRGDVLRIVGGDDD